MGINDNKPRCMNNKCKKVWSGEFIASNFVYSFYNKKYLNRRADLLHEREKSLLPGTQESVKYEKKKIKNKKKIADLKDEISMYRELIGSAQTKIRKLRDEVVYKCKKKSGFTRACPVDECRGFLSTGLKCGICSTFGCANCHLAKAGRNDPDHKCDPDLVATVKLLASDTKPCPACTTPIYKINGCDQMYCTLCHTPFSWISGLIERGIIHNPHFYAFQREQNGGIAPRNNGDIPCGGGLPNYQDVVHSLNQVVSKFSFGNVHMLVGHINRIELHYYPNVMGDVNNADLRIDYLMNRIDDDQWNSKLKSRMKKQEKNSDIHLILTMFTDTLTDIFGNIILHTTLLAEKYKFVESMDELRKYTNKQLQKIGNRYGNVYPSISKDFKFWPNSKTMGMYKKTM